MTMITDGQLVYESFQVNTNSGVGLVLGEGIIPDAAALVTAAKYASAGYRMIGSALLKTHLKTTLARNIIFDGAFADVNDVPVKGGYLQFSFSKSNAAPTALLTGTPTWGMILRPHNTAIVNGDQLLNAGCYFRHWYLFTVGIDGSGADVIMPGSGQLTAGQILRMSDIKIPITNLIT